MRRFGVAMGLLLAIAPAWAVQPDEILKDPELEARARGISSGLRCLVCQNQSIDESDAGIARDLRILIREQLQQGRTDDEVVDFVVDRYGSFVLLRPRFEASTVLLWLAPFALLGLALLVAFRRRASGAAEPLDQSEKDEIAALLRKDGQDSSKLPQA